MDNPALIACLMAGFVVLYLIVTLRLLRRKPALLWIPAALIAIGGFVLYWQAYLASGVPNWFSRTILSIVGSLNLFLFNAISTYGRLFNYFYVSDAMSGSAEAVQVHLILLEGLLACASWTTSILTVHLFARRFSSRLWLWFHRPSGKRRHLFFGDERRSLLLAADLAKNPDNQLLFVLSPSRETLPGKVSFLQILRGIRPDTVRLERIRTLVPGAIILTARQSIKECTGDHLFKELGLTQLAKWTVSESDALYFLSEDEDDNLSAVHKLPPCRCKVFCRASRSGVNDSIVQLSTHDIRLVDEAFLTVKQMKMDAALMPVRFVDTACDDAGQPLGWVRSGFHSMVLGFGETGQGMLSYLYEFGAFVGEDKKPLPFCCDVVDRSAAALEGTFRMEHPAIPDEKVRFLPMEVGSKAFWRYFQEQLGSLNYVAIALGEDQKNVRLALDMLELFCHQAIQRLPAIVVKLDEPEKYKKLINFYMQNLGVDCIRILGGLDAWTEWNIIDETFEQYARAFYDAYCRASGEPVAWEDRIRKIEQADTTPLWKKKEYRRKVGQDYSDYMHMEVKKMLCPVRLYQDSAVSDAIPVEYDGQHCTDRTAAPVLEYLAIGEHLRWQAAHEIAGYRCGDRKREDLKIHPALQDYWNLPEQTRHYDWIVVKTTLQLLHQEP